MAVQTCGRRAILPADGYTSGHGSRQATARSQTAALRPPRRQRCMSMADPVRTLAQSGPDTGRSDRWLWSVTIVTMHASGLQGEIHDRSPLILSADRINAWLDLALTDPDHLQAILSGIEPLAMQIRELSAAVNRVSETDRNWLRRRRYRPPAAASLAETRTPARPERQYGSRVQPTGTARDPAGRGVARASGVVPGQAPEQTGLVIPAGPVTPRRGRLAGTRNTLRHNPFQPLSETR